MTTTNEDIGHALYKHYSSFTASIRMVSENESYVPALNTPYLKTWLLPAETLPITLGPTGVNEYAGIFQITCIYPQSIGWNAAKIMAGRLCTHFYRNTQVTYNNILVKVRRSWVDPGFQEDAWYHIPVSVLYWCFDNSS